MSTQDIILCEKDIKVIMLEMKVHELQKDIKIIKEALGRYHITKENQDHATSIIEIITRLLYIKKENTEEQQIESSLSDFCFCGLYGQN